MLVFAIIYGWSRVWGMSVYAYSNHTHIAKTNVKKEKQKRNNENPYSKIL
jgi:hypothetical protein